MKSKLLIFGQSDDPALNHVCNWLFHSNVEFLRINDEIDVRQFVRIFKDNEKLEIILRYNNNLINVLEYNLIWFRRGHLNFSCYFNPKDFSNKEVSDIIMQQLISESKSVEKFIDSVISKNSINNPSNYNCDKLTALNAASECGLNVPRSIFFNGKLNLNYEKEYFIKPNLLSLGSYLSKSVSFQAPHVFLDSCDQIDSQLTLLQDYVQKEFELRIFYFCGYIFAVAIMSQTSESTKYDSRNVTDKMIRYIPFKLNKELTKKINKFMNHINLKSGSIDMIYTKDKNFIFLEVNPVGQFDYIGALTGKCLDKRIAQILKNENEKIKKSS